jgi:sortase (surface protein transpeptidase)
MAKIRNIFSNLTTNRRSTIAAAVVVSVLVLAFLGWKQSVMAPSYVENISTTTAAKLTVMGETLPESAPVHISIPAASIEADFEVPLGLQQNGEIEVPETYDKVAYYGYGPTPGELGPAVILGHVDSLDGPAVFFSLGQLKEGDGIEVKREDGKTAVFSVTNVERHPQSGFPTREVYQDIDHAGLRLITCTGVYDHGTLRYSHNLIVFAKLVEVREVQ